MRYVTVKESCDARTEVFMKSTQKWIAAALLAGALGLAAALSLARPAAAQSPQPSDDQVNAIASGLYCPVCENIPLDVCGTQACAQWRDLIREKLAAGWSEQQIKDYFVAQYGDRVLAEPPARGLNWLVYILPPVLILGALAYVIYLLRRMRSEKAPVLATPPSSAPADPYAARLEEELRKRR
jgi:cytochrome c-type biogenesis protein CcmH